MIPSLLHRTATAVSRNDEECDWLIADLNLDRIFQTMAAGDPLIHRIARRELVQSAGLDVKDILFRQNVLSDCLRGADVFFELHDCLTAHLQEYRGYQKRSLPSFSTFIAATSVLKDTVALMEILLDCVKKAKGILRRLESTRRSAGIDDFLQAFFAFFDDDFLCGAYGQIEEIQRTCADSYALISAGVGGGLKVNQYVLQSISRTTAGKGNKGSITREIPLASIGIQAQAGVLRDAGLQQISRMLKEVNEKIDVCLQNIHEEVGFYIGCIRLHRALRAIGVPVCFPRPLPRDSRTVAFQYLMDGSLALSNGCCPVGNSMQMEDFRLAVVTGANQGGKSTFLRSFGCAQLMMQCGMFVCADAFSAGCCSGVYTHFCHCEAQQDNQGRLHEELLRIQKIVHRCDRDALVLLNETFSSTSEREASLLAEEIVMAYYQLNLRTIYVTHFYEFAKNAQRKNLPGTHFYAAARKADGTRRFAIEPAFPQKTSYGMDIFRDVFEE